MFVVTGWPWRIVTAGIRPMTWAGSVTTPFALVGSSGTSRIATSSATMAWRAGIARTATTTATFWSVGLAGLLLGLVDQVERGAAGHEGQDHADDDDELASPAVVAEFQSPCTDLSL